MVLVLGTGTVQRITLLLKIHKSGMTAAKSKRKNSNENMNATSLNFRHTFVLLPEGNTLKKDHGDINNFSEPVGTAILEAAASVAHCAATYQAHKEYTLN